MARYAPLLEITVTHAYYADGRCRGLRFKPTVDTAAWLREIDGLSRETGSGLLVLGDPSRLGIATANPLGLGWALHCEDAGFAAVTEGLPAPGAGQRVQRTGDSNAAGAADLEPPGGELMLFRLPADVDKVGERPLHAGARAGTRDLWPLVWPTVSSQLGAAQRRWPPLALVQVPAPAADDAAAGRTRYSIQFAARAPVWKYCLVGDWSDDSLEVVASSGGLPVARSESPFREEQAQSLPDGRRVRAFLSAQGIELRERPERRFELRNAADKRVLLERLPAAGAEHFAFESSGDKRELVSEIYVHR